ncbi:hypothetical protein AB0M91_12735 [Micromonospora rifamycinica]|uniref:outer membrane protein assembly factor BamB family protein n=1 Tax=Micromonospora rifamycinica TaxID=291594 RepID=UPI00342861E2
MTVIDLGELRDVEPEPSGTAPRAVGRPLRLAVVLAFTLLVLAAAAPVAHRAAFVLPAPLGTAVLLDDEEVFLHDPTGDPTAPARLSAWTIPTSPRDRPVRRWQTSVPVTSGSGTLRRHSDVVLLSGASGRPDGEYRTFAYDRGTGRLRWQRAGAGETAGAGLLFTEYGPEGPLTVHSADPATGRDRWSVSMPSAAMLYRSAADGVDRIVTVRPPDAVEVWDARRGVRLHGAQLNHGGTPSDTGFDVVGDLLLTVQRSSGRLTAYGLDGLDRRWQVPLTAPLSFTPCGPLICASGQAGGVRALDPATGRTVWQDARWEFASDQRGGRAVVSSLGRGGWHPLVVLDVASGRQVADLGVWQLVAPTTPDGRMLGWRPAGAGRMTVAEVDVAAATVRVLDVLPTVSGDCRTDAGLLLCRLVDGTFGVWRLPR